MTRDGLRTVHIGHHFFGAGNIGDDLMLAGFLACVQDRLDHLRLTCCTPHDRLALRRRFPQVDWLEYTPHARRRAIERADAWLGLGGSPFQISDGDWFAVHLAEEATICREAGVPMHFVGVGVNDASALERADLQAVLRQAAGVWTRDARSAHLLAPRARVQAGGDLAHVYLAERAGRSPEPRNGLALCLRFHGEVAEHAAALLTLLSQTPGEVQWLVQEIRPLPGCEIALQSHLPAALKARCIPRIPDATDVSCDEILDAWPPFGALLSSRYHATLVAAWAGARVGVVAITDKLRGVAEELGIPAFATVAEVDLDALAPVHRQTLMTRVRAASDAVVAWLAALDALPRRGTRFTAMPPSTRRHPAGTPPSTTPHPARHLAVISADSLGDLVLRQPLLEALLDAGHRVTLAARPATRALAPFIDARLETLEIPIDPYRLEDPATTVCALEPFIDDLATRGVDAIVSPQYNRTVVDERLAARFAHLPRIGLAPGVAPPLSPESLALFRPDIEGKPPFTVQVFTDVAAHETEKNRAILEMGFDLSPARDRPSLTRHPEAVRAGRRVLASLGLRPGRYALFSPVGGANVTIKAVPSRISAAVARHLQARWHLPTLLTGVEAERDTLETLRAECQAAGAQTHLWIGETATLGTLLGLVADARLFFGGDTGPMHLAAALGVPVAAVFGGGTWPRFTPVAEKAFVAVQPLDCFGCAWRCLHDRVRCLDDIAPQAVIEGVDGLLA